MCSRGVTVAAWEVSLASDRPGVLEVKTDPEVLPLPLHITLGQARKFISMLVKADPDEWRVLIGTAKEALASVLPGRD